MFSNCQTRKSFNKYEIGLQKNKEKDNEINGIYSYCLLNKYVIEKCRKKYPNIINGYFGSLD